MNKLRMHVREGGQKLTAILRFAALAVCLTLPGLVSGQDSAPASSLDPVVDVVRTGWLNALRDAVEDLEEGTTGLSTIEQAEAEAGTSTTRRIWTAERVAQAIAALAGGGGIVYVDDCTGITTGFCIDTDGTDETVGIITVDVAGSGYVAEVASQGTITMSGIATADETFVIHDQTFTWKATRALAGEVTIGATAAAACTNIIAAVTLDVSAVVATQGAGTTVIITAATAGVAGNSIVFTENSTNMGVNGAGTLGTTTAGVDGDVLTIDGGNSDATVVVTSVSGTGGITGLRISAAGTEYDLLTYDLTGGSGTFGDVTVTAFGDYGKFYYFDNTAVVATPIEHLVGVSQNVQTQLDAKQNITAALTSIKSGDTEVTVTSDSITMKVEAETIFIADSDGVRMGMIGVDLGIPDGQASGIPYVGITAGAAISKWDVVYYDRVTSQWQKATRTLASDGAIRGIAIEDCAVDAECTVLFKGSVYDSANISYTVGDLCLGDVAGALVSCEVEEISPAESIGRAHHVNRAVFHFDRMIAQVTYTPPAAGSAVCTTYYDGLDLTEDSVIRAAGGYNNQQYSGNILDDNATGDICKVTWRLRAGAGTASDYDYYTEIWLLDNVDDGLETFQGRSDMVAGAAWGTGTEVAFTFTDNVTYDTTGTNRYAIVLRRVAAGVSPTTSNPAYDTLNYVNHTVAAEAAMPAQVEGRAFWKNDKGLNTTVGIVNTELIKFEIFTMQTP